jgi:hypothetical protein
MSQGLPVELEAFLLEGVDEFAVRQAVRSDCGVDLHIPEAAKISLLVATVGESIDASVHESVIGGALGIGPAETETLGGLEDGPAVLESIYGFFDSCHGSTLSVINIKYYALTKNRLLALFFMWFTTDKRLLELLVAVRSLALKWF